MLDAVNYSAFAKMNDGRVFQIRSQKKEDEAEVLAAVARTSHETLYRRFFGPKHRFTPAEIAFFMNADFVSHVCLLAIVDERDHPAAVVGGVRYLIHEPGKAEISFSIIDAYQGQGIGSRLMQHAASIARDAHLEEFRAEVMLDNLAMLKVFKDSGLPIEITRDPEGAHVTLHIC